MLASPMQGENERQRKKVNENTYDISSIKRVTKKFLKVHVVVVQSNGKEMSKRKVCCTWNVGFLLIRPIAVLHRSPSLTPALTPPLSITRFYILFEQTINVIESFAFSPG